MWTWCVVNRWEVPRAIVSWESVNVREWNCHVAEVDAELPADVETPPNILNQSSSNIYVQQIRRRLTRL
jgi:hypothetical protein